jgi:heme exporter protein D
MMWLVSLATGIGIPPRFAKYAVIAAGVVLLGLAILAAVKIHDHRVIAAHAAKQDAANAKADQKADAKAAEQRRTDDARVTTETQEINNAVSEAKRAGTDPRAAYYKCVSLQQRARAAKLVVPACS